VEQAALLADTRGGELFVAGPRLDLADLQRRAGALGDLTVRVLPKVPLDRRHNSKVDYGALRRLARPGT
jgi:hypothetical protein